MPKTSEADLYEFQSEDEDGHQMQPGELEGVGERMGVDQVSNRVGCCSKAVWYFHR